MGKLTELLALVQSTWPFAVALLPIMTTVRLPSSKKVFVPTRFDDFLQRGQRQSDMPQCSRHCPSFAAGDDCRMRNSAMSIAASVPAASPQTNLVVDLAHRVK